MPGLEGNFLARQCFECVGVPGYGMSVGLVFKGVARFDEKFPRQTAGFPHIPVRLVFRVDRMGFKGLSDLARNSSFPFFFSFFP